MSELLNGFGFSYAKWDATIAVCALGLWAVVVACAILSIRAQSFGPIRRRFWIAAVILVPIVGLFAYLPFSLRSEAPSLRGWTKHNRLAPRPSPSDAPVT